MSLSGRKIWLIGASEGIGFALAEQLLGAGAQIALSARNRDKLQEIAQRFPPQQSLILPLDVTDLASIHAAWEKLCDSWICLDSAIYNAGSYEPMNAS